MCAILMMMGKDLNIPYLPVLMWERGKGDFHFRIMCLAPITGGTGLTRIGIQ